jgi:hypothetical protein
MLPGVRRRSPLTLLPLLLTLALLAGCGSSGESSSSSTSAKSPRHPAEPQAGASRSAPPTERVARAAGASGRLPGRGGRPAAGVCPHSHAAVVTIELFFDVPSPRCLVVTADQRLRLVNRTAANGQPGTTVSLHFAGFAAKIPPNHAALLDAPVGDYLPPGVSGVPLRGAPAPELWLRGDSSKSG